MGMTTTECVDRMTSKVGTDSLSVEGPIGGRNNGEGAPLKKGPWTKEEDTILKDFVAKYGEGNWSSVHRRTELARCGKSCRLRWSNHLKPNLKKGAFTPEEEDLIIELHAKIGNKWVKIAAQIPGRTDNDIKNFWNSRLRKQRRAEKYLDPPDLCFDELHEDIQNKELVTSSSNRIADISHLSFSGDIHGSHTPIYGNSSYQTPMESWSSPSSIPSLQYTDSCSLSPRSSVLLNATLHQSQTHKASWNNSHQETSRFVVPDSCPVLRETLQGTNIDSISPYGHSITSMINDYTPNTGGSLVEHQSIAPLVGFDVNQEMVDFAPTGGMDDPLNSPLFSGSDWYFAPTDWPHNRMG